MITQSWLVESIDSEELFNNRYIAFAVVQRKDWESNAEDLWVTVMTKNLKRINLCFVYIPPVANHTRNIYDFTDKLRELRALHHDDNFLIAGDFYL